MRDVPKALDQWWALVREGGYLVLVVPDEDLYEQGGWPSLFNTDHKATFRFRKEATWSPVSYDVERLVGALKGASIISCERHDKGYDYQKRKERLSPVDRALYRAQWLVGAVFRRLGSPGRALNKASTAFFSLFNTPVDQTAGPALAQIQIIARKMSSQ